MGPANSSIKRIDLIVAISILERKPLAGFSLKCCQSTIRRKTARIDVINQMSGKAGGNLVERMLCHALNFAEA